MTHREQAIDRDRQSALVQGLRGILPAASLLVEEEDTAPYDCDGLTLYRE